MKPKAGSRQLHREQSHPDVANSFITNFDGCTPKLFCSSGRSPFHVSTHWQTHARTCDSSSCQHTPHPLALKQ